MQDQAGFNVLKEMELLQRSCLSGQIVTKCKNSIVLKQTAIKVIQFLEWKAASLIIKIAIPI